MKMSFTKGLLSGGKTTNRIPQGSVLGTILFNILLNYSHTKSKRVLIKFADNPKLGAMVDVEEGIIMKELNYSNTGVNKNENLILLCKVQGHACKD